MEIEQVTEIAKMEEIPSKTAIQKFFEGQTIFVTGGTGFLGKLLIEKLLRSCYDLKKIYVLVRNKKGKTQKERFDEIFEAEVSFFRI